MRILLCALFSLAACAGSPKTTVHTHPAQTPERVSSEETPTWLFACNQVSETCDPTSGIVPFEDPMFFVRGLWDDAWFESSSGKNLGNLEQAGTREAFLPSMVSHEKHVLTAFVSAKLVQGLLPGANALILVVKDQDDKEMRIEVAVTAGNL